MVLVVAKFLAEKINDCWIISLQLYDNNMTLLTLRIHGGKELKKPLECKCDYSSMLSIKDVK
jgi:hypothetical protein